MKQRYLRWTPLAAVLALASCATVPTGPSVMALPGHGKTFEQFRYDDYQCRQFASEQIGGRTAQQAATENGVKNAAIGAGVGAVAGGLMGGDHSAGVGAGLGLLAGSVIGAGSASATGQSLQRRYDIAYEQCMYAKGDRVPMAGRLRARRVAAPPPPPPPPRREDREDD